jgi:hypothetical protein
VAAAGPPPGLCRALGLTVTTTQPRLTRIYGPTFEQHPKLGQEQCAECLTDRSAFFPFLTAGMADAVILSVFDFVDTVALGDNWRIPLQLA